VFHSLFDKKGRARLQQDAWRVEFQQISPVTHRKKLISRNPKNRWGLGQRGKNPLKWHRKWHSSLTAQVYPEKLQKTCGSSAK